MNPGRHARPILVLGAAIGAIVLPGCGGRASARAVTGAEAPPIGEWERPSRATVEGRAIRLDRPEATDSEDAGDADQGTTGIPSVAAPKLKTSVQDLRIPLEPGMTLYSIARTYQVPLPTLMRRNGITDPAAIPAGTMIVIPGVSNGGGTGPSSPSDGQAGAPRPPSRSKGTGAAVLPRSPGADAVPAPALMGISWPIDGAITGGFGLRGRHHHHEGIDIDGYQGEEVRAVAAGTVVVSGSEKKYGKTVVIDHGNGVTTLYAHASKLLVREGDHVDQGDVIARVGATGNARGTHLHFEVRRNGKAVDPSPYLQAGTVPLATP